MRSLPLPLRVAAGLAVTAVEQARVLPAKIAGLPVTVASQALQVSMRVQQHVTELAIRGDQVLSGLHPVEETPEWATFDEDLADDATVPAPFERVAEDWSDDTGNGQVDTSLGDETASDDDAADADADDPGTDPWALEELLDHERTHANRPAFVGMLTRRIATVRDHQ
jgi:hypothetical protein